MIHMDHISSHSLHFTRMAHMANSFRRIRLAKWCKISFSQTYILNPFNIHALPHQSHCGVILDARRMRWCDGCCFQTAIHSSRVTHGCRNFEATVNCHDYVQLLKAEMPRELDSSTQLMQASWRHLICPVGRSGWLSFQHLPGSHDTWRWLWWASSS